MQQTAQARHGRCLSKEYISLRTPLIWECRLGHRWSAKPEHILRGHWCHDCCGRHSDPLGEMHRIAQTRGGSCLSRHYESSRTKLKWRCAHGHEWSAVSAKVKRGSWCPHCSDGIGERICRAYFEQIFKHPFPKSRPSWLKSDSGAQMELDGYCRELGIAFEHQGEQHYSTATHMIRCGSALEKRKALDRKKREMCRAQGVALVEIDEIPGRVSLNSLADHLSRRCAAAGVVPPSMEEPQIDLAGAYMTGGAKLILDHLTKISASRGGQCLSDIYLGTKVKLSWLCAKGHRWSATPGKIMAGQWCPLCAGNRSLDIRKAEELARGLGGECTSLTYQNSRQKLGWRCAKGHVWSATYNSVYNGSWCPECNSRREISIRTLKDHAYAMGGLCLSAEYTNNTQLLSWQCRKGHRWKAKVANVLAGRWCPECAKPRRATSRKKFRLSLTEMREVAGAKGGKCLSQTYTNTSTKLTWQCSKGHTWEAKPNDIRNGSWCPTCGGTRRASIEEMQHIAEERGGRCLSLAYINGRTKLEWRCQRGHTWLALPMRVKRGQWCPKCYHDSRRNQKDSSG
jgi:hypothetical protein